MTYRFSIDKTRLPDFKLLLLAFLATSFYLAFLCIFFEPLWETNDDIAMSMVAHGFGLAAYPSPNIIFSNVLWGFFIKLIPSINGVLGYSIATLLVLFVSGTAILYFLCKLDVSIIIALILTALVLLRPTLFPQFTINAGLITVAAVLGFLVYSRTNSIQVLIFSSALAFVGYLIRSQEFFLVGIVSLPILFSYKVAKDGNFRVSLLAIAVAIAVVSMFDYYCYQGDEWRRFNEINLARAPFTDFGLSKLIKNRPEILAKYGYSDNDLSLIENFFFVDPEIVNPSTLTAMMKEYGSLPFLLGNIGSGLSAIRALTSINILPLTLLGVFLFLLSPKKSIALSWIVFFLILFVMGLAGRGGVLRVYIPLLSLLVVVAIVKLRYPLRLNLSLLACLLALGFGFTTLFPQTVSARNDIQEAQRIISGLPSDEVLVSWGVGLRIERIYPLLAENVGDRKIKIYPFGVFTHAPFSTAYTEESRGRGFIKRLRSPEGILVIAASHNIEQLRTWCHERFNGKLEDETILSTPLDVVTRVWCSNEN